MTKSPESAARGSLTSSPSIGKFGEDSPQFFIFVEKIPLCYVTSFSRAIYLWFSVHYIFHLQYHQQLQEFALFFQESVFGIPMHCKKTTTYLATATDIQKYTLQ